MIAIRVLLWSVLGAAALALLGSWGYGAYFRRLDYRSELPFIVYGCVGALVGAIAAASQSVVEQMRKGRAGNSDQH